MDLGIGRILEQLDKLGLTENTVVLFTSDNGNFSGEHGLVGKWLMYEPSLRVPGFLFDPRKPVATSSDRMVLTTDFSATLLSLAGIEIPNDLTGRDLTELLENPKANWRDEFLYSHPYAHGGRIPRTLGVRTTRYTYTRYIDTKPPFEQLFDLKDDPDQLTNLATDPEHATLLNKLRKRCDDLFIETGPISSK
jgi:arylsulfatase A-like enzyme